MREVVTLDPENSTGFRPDELKLGDHDYAHSLCARWTRICGWSEMLELTDAYIEGVPAHRFGATGRR